MDLCIFKPTEQWVVSVFRGGWALSGCIGLGCAFLVFVGWGCIFTGSGLSVAFHFYPGSGGLLVPDGLPPLFFLLVSNGVALRCGFFFSPF